MLLTELLQFLNAARLAIVDGDEIVVAQEKIDVERCEPMLLHPEIDAVEDHVEIAVVALHLRIVDVAERILNRQRV